MTTEQDLSLEQLVRQVEPGWIVDHRPTPAEGLQIIRKRLEQVRLTASSHGFRPQIDFSESALISQYRRSPHKVRAFLQAIFESDSPDMLVMVWRVLQGMDVSELSMTCKEGRFKLRILLRSPSGQIEEYDSANIDDAALLRHFGVMKMGEESVFVGFYPTVTPK